MEVFIKNCIIVGIFAIIVGHQLGVNIKNGVGDGDTKMTTMNGIEHIKVNRFYKLTVIVPVYNQEELVLRALYSIPNRQDIHIVIINDGSTDNTKKKIDEFMDDETRNQDITFHNLLENKGVSNAVNMGLQHIRYSEYTVLLGSDDYFLPAIEEVIDQTSGEDLVYFNLQINNGDVWAIADNNKVNYCGSVKLMRSEFIQGLQNDINRKYGEDYYFFQDILKRNPTEKFTNIIAKHYNYPRKNSLSWQQRHNIN